ncbi:glycoprotein 96-92 [Angomonas deanei]|uniref:Uncharacterized protein n=1 Tax=Angomonas deanei TaxID=59799 RepID=A0A7G2CDC7_9TRYP|nr:glycoprotein 96-92 [Angomonas deanei]CAD2216132.1 hypothetical protein, conserved [Angomonas deanei]|eukprot:EPY18314.1 glycoprotein 96-92 [Angomonas deanei]
MNNRSNKKSKPSMSPRYYDFNDFLETQKQRNEIAKERQLQLEKEIFEKETQREKIPTTALKRKINQKLEHQSGNHNKNDDGGYKGPIKNWDKRFESYQRRKSGAQAKKQHKTDPIDKEENKIKANVAFNRLYADFIMRTDKNAEKQLAEEQYRRTSLFAPRLHGTESLHRAHPIPEEHEEDRPTPSPPPPATQQEQTPRGNELLLNLRPAQLTRDQLLDTNSTSSRQTPRQISPRKGSSPSVFDKLYADHQVNSPLARQRRLEERRAQEVEQSMRSSPRINKNTDALLARRKSHPDENHALVSKREALILKQKQREEERIRLEREKQAKINAKFDLEKFLSREEKFHQKREEVKHSYLLKEYVEEMTQCTFMPELSPRSRMLYLAKQQEIQYGVMPRARSPSYDEAIVLPERNSPKRNPDNTNLSQLEWELEEMMKGWHSMI